MKATLVTQGTEVIYHLLRVHSHLLTLTMCTSLDAWWKVVCYSYQPHHRLSWWRSLPKALQGQSTIYGLAAILLLVSLLAEGFLPFAFQKLLTVHLEKGTTWTTLRMQKEVLSSSDLCSCIWCLWVQTLSKLPGTGVKRGARDHIHWWIFPLLLDSDPEQMTNTTAAWAPPAIPTIYLQCYPSKP